MTTLAPAPAPPLLPSTRPAPGFRARFALSWRLMRRGAALMWLTAAAYMAIEVLVFRSAYPDEASRQKLLELSTSTVVRMMQGVPGAVDTAGGFAVWDGGWMLDDHRRVLGAAHRDPADSWRGGLRPRRTCAVPAADRPAGSRRAPGRDGRGCSAVSGWRPRCRSSCSASPLPPPCCGVSGSAALCAVAAALGALVAQVVEPRRRAVSVGLGLLAAAFVVRVVANSADRRIWLLTVAPFGWVERLRAFSGNDWPWLLAPLAAMLVLAATALAVCGRRDAGAALVRSSGAHRSTFRLLGSAPGFGWRLGSGALLALGAHAGRDHLRVRADDRRAGRLHQRGRDLPQDARVDGHGHVRAGRRLFELHRRLPRPPGCRVPRLAGRRDAAGGGRGAPGQPAGARGGALALARRHDRVRVAGRGDPGRRHDRSSMGGNATGGRAGHDLAGHRAHARAPCRWSCCSPASRC